MQVPPIDLLQQHQKLLNKVNNVKNIVVAFKQGNFFLLIQTHFLCAPLVSLEPLGRLFQCLNWLHVCVCIWFVDKLLKWYSMVYGLDKSKKFSIIHVTSRHNLSIPLGNRIPDDDNTLFYFNLFWFDSSVS